MLSLASTAATGETSTRAACSLSNAWVWSAACVLSALGQLKTPVPGGTMPDARVKGPAFEPAAVMVTYWIVCGLTLWFGLAKTYTLPAFLIAMVGAGSLLKGP